jgi:hypothetical protein
MSSIQRGRNNFSELGTHSRSAEKPSKMSKTYYKEIITLKVLEFVPTCITVENNSYEVLKNWNNIVNKKVSWI